MDLCLGFPNSTPSRFVNIWVLISFLSNLRYLFAYFSVLNRRIHADVIVYIIAHLHTALRTEGNMLDMI